MLLHVAVSDTGIGIPAARREKLFQAFEQVDNLDEPEVRRHRTGAGDFGARLVELMGG